MGFLTIKDASPKWFDASACQCSNWWNTYQRSIESLQSPFPAYPLLRPKIISAIDARIRLEIDVLDYFR